MDTDKNKKVLIITYYWPPSSGSGVQRWMYFAKYLSDFGVTPIVLTVDPQKASYRKLDHSFNDFIHDIKVYKTKTLEPLKLYSLLTTGSVQKGIPQGSVGSKKNSLFSKISRYIRGNVFIPDARIGWKRYAVNAAEKIIGNENIDLIISTGPPHSTHLIARVLKRKLGVKWIADFRDPWTEIYYNQDLIQTEKSKLKDKKLEMSVLQEADHILTIGPSMAALLSEKINTTSKVSYIYNGYDAIKMNSIESQKNEDHFVISFIGLMTEAMPHQSFTKAFQSFITNHTDAKIIIRIAGDINEHFLSDLKKGINTNQSIEYIGYVAHHEALRLMKSANMLFTCLPTQEHSKIMISGKMLEYLATGNPVLCIGDDESDAAKIIEKSKNSLTCSPDAIDEIEAFIATTYSNWKNGFDNHLDNEHIESLSRYNTAKQLSELINTII